MTIQNELQSFANKQRAVFVARYFKTGKGEYGEGDIFLGLTVPQQRAIANKYRDLPLSDIEKLLQNKIHEFRLTALLIVCAKFKNASESEQKNIVDLYVRNTKYINNWDLVDLSSHVILGTYLLDKPRKILYTFARSKNLWEKRIAVITTFAFIRNNDFSDAFAIAEEAFLQKHYRVMPRTMLRYAIERFSVSKREFYLRHI